MSTLYRDTKFLQVLGDTTYANTGEPTARASVLVPSNADFASNPFRLYANGRFTIELDATNRGGGVLAIDPIVVQRTAMPHAAQFPVAAGVVWTPVPAAEMGFAAIAAGNIQVEEFQGSANYAYRLFAAEADITNAGDLWIAVNVPKRFSR